MRYRSAMSSERDIVDELWRFNPLSTLRMFFEERAEYYTRKLRHAMVRGRMASGDGPIPLPEGIDEAEIVAALRAAHAASRLREEAMNRLREQTDKLPTSNDEHLTFTDQMRSKFEVDVASIELLTLALEFELATEADKRLFAAARESIERRMAIYLVTRGERAHHSRPLAELIERLVKRRRFSFRRRASRDPAMLEVRAVRQALVLERAMGAGISVEEADAQDRARWA